MHTLFLNPTQMKEILESMYSFWGGIAEYQSLPKYVVWKSAK